LPIPYHHPKEEPRVKKLLPVTTATLVGTLVLASFASSGGGAPRQKYSGWTYNPDKNYYYRKYEYKVKPTDQEYKYDYCVYYKNDAKINNKWVYFYNPQTQKYWGRYPTVNNDKYKQYAEKQQDAWSELPMEYRQRDLYKIDTKYFPDPMPNYCPYVPGSEDKVQMLAPPPDLP
jgi:hypothetical protein